MRATEEEDTPLVRFAVEARPVSVNASLRVGRGHAYKSQEAEDYQLAVYATALEWRLTHGYYARETLAGRLQGARVRLTFWGVRGDADNYAKLTVDGLAQGLGVNDRCFAEVTCRRVTTRPGLHSGVKVEVWPA